MRDEPSLVYRYALAAIISIAALSIILAWTSSLAWYVTAAGLAVIWISLTPSLLYLLRIDDAPMPFAPYIGLYYAVFFGLPIFAAPLAYSSDGKVVLYHRVVLGPIGFDVLLLAGLGISGMLVAFYFGRERLFSRVPRLRLPLADSDAGTLNWLYILLLIASLGYRYVAALSAVPSIGQLLDPASYLALGGLYLQWRAGRLPRWVALSILIVGLPLELFWRLRYLMLTDFLLLGVFFAFVLLRCSARKSLAVLVIGGTVVTFAYTATGAIRWTSETAWGRFAALGSYIVGMAHMERETDPRMDGGSVSYDPRISRLINRVGQIWIFQHVYESSPDRVGYLGGETYRPLATAIIPRILYPGKPEERAGALFGLRYGFTELQNDRTSFNIPWIVELLANFGPWGVLLGMTFFGLLLAFLDKVFNAHGMSDLEFLIGLTMLFRLGYQESNFSVMTGSLPLLFICLYGYFRVGPPLLRRAAAACT